MQAYETRGFFVCETADVEDDLEKIAIYTTSDGKPQHVARQLLNGLWTSKLGRLEDIEHQLSGLEGKLYGSPEVFMARSILKNSQ